jgi:hypothetical protein
VERVKVAILCSWLSLVDVDQQVREIIHNHRNSKPQWYCTDKIFESWENRTSTSSTLWCPGQPGAGKSVLAACMSEYLLSKHEESNTGVVTFFCNYKKQQTEEQSASIILRSLCRQLLARSPELLPIVERQYPSSTKNTETADAKDKSIGSVLLPAMAETVESCYIVIDAWDELMDAEKRELLRSFNALLRQCDHVRLLVTSRNSEKHHFSNALCMPITAKADGVAQYLQWRFKNVERSSALNKLSDEESKHLIEPLRNRVLGYSSWQEFTWMRSRNASERRLSRRRLQAYVKLQH